MISKANISLLAIFVGGLIVLAEFVIIITGLVFLTRFAFESKQDANSFACIKDMDSTKIGFARTAVVLSWINIGLFTLGVLLQPMMGGMVPLGFVVWLAATGVMMAGLAFLTQFAFDGKKTGGKTVCVGNMNTTKLGFARTFIVLSWLNIGFMFLASVFWLLSKTRTVKDLAAHMKTSAQDNPLTGSTTKITKKIADIL
jgi:hypothetical protein